MNDLGASGLDLKCRSERFKAIGYAFGALMNAGDSFFYSLFGLQ